MQSAIFRDLKKSRKQLTAFLFFCKISEIHRRKELQKNEFVMTVWNDKK